MNDPYAEAVVQTPEPGMMAALIAGAFIQAGVAVWLKPRDSQLLTVCYPLTQVMVADQIFQSLKNTGKKINEETPSRHGRLRK